MSGLFRNATLEFYGVKTAKIKELINVELPVVEVAETSTDFIFLLEDDTYLHFEFQSSYSKKDLTRFAMYDLRLYERDNRKIQTVIIYSSDVRKAADSLDIGSLVYAPAKVMMYDYDGNAIYADLEVKLRNGSDLTDTDMLNLILLPLMRNDISKTEFARKSIEMARTIKDKNRRDACVASAVAFMNKYLNDNEINNILEVLRMTDIFTRLITEEIIKREIEIAKRMIAKNEPIEKIADFTGLDIDTVKELQADENDETDK